MQIDGWMVRADEKGNMLRQSRERPDHYVITVINRYAIDIELSKELIDKIPKDSLRDRLIEIVKGVIQQRGRFEPEFLSAQDH